VSGLTRLTTLLAFGLLAACGGPSVRETCDTLDDASCSTEFDFDYNDCLDDGTFLEDDARSKGCDEQFDEYVSCVHVTVCTFDIECTVEHDTLDQCVGGFP